MISKFYNPKHLAFALALLIMPSIVIAQDIDSNFGPELPMDMAVINKKPLTDEEAIEAFEQYYIEQIFADTLSMNKTSLLSDEEKQSIGFGVDTSAQDEMQKKEFSKILAKRDILGFKRLILKKKKPAIQNEPR